MPKLATRARASPTVRRSGTAARTAIAMPRLVPMRYRRVKPVTTHAFRRDSTRSMRSPDEIPEHGVQAVVGTLDSADLELRVCDDSRELSVERVRFSRPYEEFLGRRKFERDDMVHPGERLSELTRSRRIETHGVGMGVDQRADRVDIAGCNRLAVVDQHDVVRDPLDLVEDVGRHKHVTARLGKLRDRPEDLDAGHGVRPGERFVEDQALRFVSERLRELRPLSHPAAVGPRQSLRGRGQPDDLEGFRGGLPGVGGRHPVEAQQGLNELLTCEPPVHLVVFRTVPEATHQGHVVPRILAEQPDAPLIRVELPDEELEQRALPRAVRTDEACDAATERCREGVQTEHLTVPLRDADGIDDAGHPVTTSTAFMRTYVTRPATIVAATRITRDHAQSITLPGAPNAARATAR